MQNNREERIKALNYAGIKIIENYMKDLVGRKVTCIGNLYNFSKGGVYEIIKTIGSTFWLIDDKNSEDYFHSSRLDDINHNWFELIVDEWQPKQGEKVLISDCNVEWSVRTFIVKNNNLFYCEGFSNKKELISWKYIKPYEEEIKVGDWVFLNKEKGVCKITDKHDLKEVNDKFTLVKNPQLIELLNTEL